MLKVTLFFSTGEVDEQGQVLKEQTFIQGFISGRAFRKTMEMKDKFKDGVDANALDSMVDYVADLFGGQFTRDQFYDGIAAENLISTIMECINTVVGGATKAIGSESSPNQ